MKQWIAFSHQYLLDHGIPEDFQPFGNAVMQVECVGYESAVGQAYFLGTRGVRSHKDGVASDRYRALLVVRNDGLIAKRSSVGKNSLPPQCRGTIAILDVLSLHHCIPDNRIETDQSLKLWIAIAIDYPRSPSQYEVEDDYRNFFKNRVSNFYDFCN